MAVDPTDNSVVVVGKFSSTSITLGAASYANWGSSHDTSDGVVVRSSTVVAGWWWSQSVSQPATSPD